MVSTRKRRAESEEVAPAPEAAAARPAGRRKPAPAATPARGYDDSDEDAPGPAGRADAQPKRGAAKAATFIQRLADGLLRAEAAGPAAAADAVAAALARAVQRLPASSLRRRLEKGQARYGQLLAELLRAGAGETEVAEADGDEADAGRDRAARGRGARGRGRGADEAAAAKRPIKAARGSKAHGAELPSEADAAAAAAEADAAFASAAEGVARMLMAGGPLGAADLAPARLRPGPGAAGLLGRLAAATALRLRREATALRPLPSAGGADQQQASASSAHGPSPGLAAACELAAQVVVQRHQGRALHHWGGRSASGMGGGEDGSLHLSAAAALDVRALAGGAPAAREALFGLLARLPLGGVGAAGSPGAARGTGRGAPEGGVVALASPGPLLEAALAAAGAAPLPDAAIAGGACAVADALGTGTGSDPIAYVARLAVARRAAALRRATGDAAGALALAGATAAAAPLPLPLAAAVRRAAAGPAASASDDEPEALEAGPSGRSSSGAGGVAARAAPAPRATDAVSLAQFVLTGLTAAQFRAFGREAAAAAARAAAAAARAAEDARAGAAGGLFYVDRAVGRAGGAEGGSDDDDDEEEEGYDFAGGEDDEEEGDDE